MFLEFLIANPELLPHKDLPLNFSKHLGWICPSLPKRRPTPAANIIVFMVKLLTVATILKYWEIIYIFPVFYNDCILLN
jgi:hypothetical protein